MSGANSYGRTETGTPWPGAGDGFPESPRDRLTAGIGLYLERDAARLRETYERLADAQQPSHLFITCVDSRVVPGLVTGSGPGDLLVLRNIGNLVPSADSGDTSVAAAIDFAVDMLGVRAITVCGHSRCGAMTGLLSAGVDDLTPALRTWLVHAAPALCRMDGAGGLERLCRVNVAEQIANLRTYPRVRDRASAGELDLIGMYVDVATGTPEILDVAAEPGR